MPYQANNTVGHDDLIFMKVITSAPVKELLAMEKARLRNFIAKTEMVLRWLEGIQKLAEDSEKKGQ